MSWCFSLSASLALSLSLGALGCQGSGHATRTPPAPSAASDVQAKPAALPPDATPSAHSRQEASLDAPALSQRPWPPPPPEGVTSDFCIELVNVLDEETCYVLPDAPTHELLLYLHGIVPPGKTSVQKTNFETVVSNASRRAGVAALLPRGRRGLAPKGREGYWGWPTSASAHAELAEELVATFVQKRAKLEALVGHSFQRLYVAGSSSGAYFAAALALNGDLEADGFGVMSGGSFSARNRLNALAPRPFYIGYGQRDSVGPAALALGHRLRDAGWPVEVSAHPVPHGAREVYLDEAFAFFRKSLHHAGAR